MSNRLQTVYRVIGPRLVFKSALLIGALLAVGYLARDVDFEQLLALADPAATSDGGERLRAMAVFLVLGAGVTAVGGPRQVVSFFAAYFFGLAWGVVLALGATVLGCLAAFSGARYFRDLVSGLLRGRVDIAIKAWAANALGVTVMIRLLPAGSNLITNLAAGASGIPLAPFVAGSALGYVPQTVVFALMGSGVTIGSGARIALAIILFAISVAVGMWIYARNRKSLSAKPAVDGPGSVREPTG